MAGSGFSSGIRRLLGRLNGRRAVLDENREIQPFADWNEVEAIADELHPHYRAIPTVLVGAGPRPEELWGLERRVMGTSIEMIGATYGHLVPDSEDYLRGLLDTFDANAKERTQSNG